MVETAPHIVQGGKAAPLEAYSVTSGGEWTGPQELQTLPTGVCSSCGWKAPLRTEGPEARCVLCALADQRRIDQAQALECEVFCSSAIARPVRLEPGGLLSCPACRSRIVEGKARRAAQRASEAGALWMQEAV